MTTASEARAVFNRRVSAWLAEDVDAYMTCWHDDMELTMPTGVVRGIDKYRRLVVGSFAWAAPVSFDVHAWAVSMAPYAPSERPSASGSALRPHADGSLVFADWTIRARRREDDVLIAWRGLSICELLDGRITWWREHHLSPPAPV
ncbi:MAG: nuclear transport factor 2 family protein [Actinomycetota bacterium]|nr:nuclear transport factor 2 family protein [Actinomycetota bacterium]